ncbi:translational GTPase TypA [Paludicola sp. MB14-C6]|uniref:translational GTPase TypA n=1 Tax=Paludihabitans sp. MB14-C6 TaxID=3070656 RepID=UPI0027DAE64A|nr:translational GTPase TypA [Paludicola sp. MB14-C6]WMJ23504.1 translational GTPase TypA [Paludicola sp. MB14-C6]
MIREDLRNVAIIAHVDHGKTTLVDEMLKQGGAFRENQVVADRVMDNNDIERERGITILAKNTAASYNGVKINIIDTPGHADFSGEVERILKMVNGVLLLVDAAEGPMPQTRFVLQKALELGHKIIIVVNKIDRPDARCHEVVDEVLELLLDLDATEEQLESPVLFCSGRDGTASLSPDHVGTDLIPMFEAILNHIDPPEGDEEGDLQVLVSSIDYNDYVGRIGIGRIERGQIKVNQDVIVADYHNTKTPYKGRIVSLNQIEGLKRVPTDSAKMGDIIIFSGIENITIGDTLCAPTNVEPLPFVKISEPTVEMTFAVNDSPFAGREGKYVTSRQIHDRLHKELLKDVSLRVTTTENSDSLKVAGRGEMHLSILIENMRREGYEFSVNPPRVLMKEVDGKTYEPIERLLIDVPEEFMGSVMEKMGTRKADLIQMTPQGSRMRIEFLIPARGLFGYRSEFLTDTKGEGILNSIFDSYQPYKGEIISRSNGSLVAFETGTAVAYGLFNAQERGVLFIDAQTPVYEGMVVGMSAKSDDLAVNVCKRKQLTNMRASGSDDALRLVPSKKMSLEECLEFINEDELLEITPKNIRIRKQILDNNLRAKQVNKKK